MTMKDHILAALKEELERWQDLLAGLSEKQVNASLLPSPWSIKDVISHLRAWQQRTIARVEAATLDLEPTFPAWPFGLDPESDENTEPLNAWIYESNRDRTWAEVHRDWQDGFSRLLKLSESISERDLLDSSRYAWLEGYPLALILLATYDHHQEHLDKVASWLGEHRS